MKYALITGAKSLLAHAVIESIKKDYAFFLVDLSPSLREMYQDIDNASFIVGDVTKEETIKKIVEEVSKKTSQLDLVIHMAGIVELGSLVEVNPTILEKVFATNLFSIYHINQILLPLLIPFKGRIIHVSSEYGRLLGLPFHSFYTMSKHALEIYNDSLRRELKGLGIKVIKIRPGAFKTSMQSRITQQFEEQVKQTKYFKDPLLKMQGMMLKELKRAKNPEKIIKTFRKAIYSRKPKIAYDVGNSFKMKLLNALPPRLQDWILAKFF
ncbi:MAG TPA: SDR family NAD(P)-dependent oxidoreductase [Bacilli bacterium]|nr:SDR family NAD(P)-dependent oxidoreductase [Bacilli bacterium]